MKVVAYLAGVPPSRKNSHKAQLLADFITGVNASGDQGIAHTGNDVLPCDVAVIQGWINNQVDTPHLRLRQAAIAEQRKNNNRLLAIDSNLFNFVNKDHPSQYHRYSFDGVFPNTGNYFWDNPDPARWKQISQDLNLSLAPWRTHGDHILICTQRNGGWSMKGSNVVDWLEQTVSKIRKHSGRPIVVRPHPGDKQAANYLGYKTNRWRLSTNRHILDDFKNAWAVVCYNSTPSVAAAISGVPVFVTDPVPQTSQAFDVAYTDLSEIELLNVFNQDRQSWVEKLAMCHWNKQELLSGAAWQHIKKFV